MIYNFVQLLRTQLPIETIFTNGRGIPPGKVSVPDRHLLVTETGGSEQAWTRYQQLTAQVIARDVDSPKARALAYAVFTILAGRFGLVLPQAVVGGVTYPRVVTAQISAIQVPYNLGADEEGRIEYTTNYLIIKER